VQLITLTTDFGTKDWFVGAMKGVILRINPRVTVVDVTHEIPSGDIRAGAFALMASCRFFPKGSVHVAVVDPGVGSARKAVAVQTANYFFVGPDNGVLSFALAGEKVKAVHRLENKYFFLWEVSHTFHGRDIFAPVAAHLSRRMSIQKLGPPAKNYAKLRWPAPKQTDRVIQGEIIYLDHFGNAITTLPNHLLTRVDGTRSLSIGRKTLCPIKAFYQSVPKRKPAAVPGSAGFLEIAVNGGSAVKVLRLKVGDPVTMTVR
jgi:S-adenosylmethionine hydrolase